MLSKKLGTEKANKFQENFDEIYDKYKKIAEDLGYNNNKIKFKKEKNKIIIYVNLFS